MENRVVTTAGRLLARKLVEAKMEHPAGSNKKVVDLEVLVERLAWMRREWEEAAPRTGKGSERQSLMEVGAPVGMIMSDMCDILAGLGARGIRQRILGDRLYQELADLLQDDEEDESE